MDNKALATRFYESINAGRLEIIDEMVSADLVEHDEMPGVPPGREGVRQFFQMVRAAFPDYSMAVEDMIAEGDTVVIRGVMRGTQQGEFMGMPATGKRMEVPFADFVRFKDGRAVEHWGVTDTGVMMRQLT